jgi:hypothetical protein
VTERRTKLDDELKRVEESCLYLAQAQFKTAAAKGGRARKWLMLMPGIVTAVVGAAVAVGAPAALGAIAALAGVTTTIASFLGVDRDAAAHELAGKTLTALRHEGRFLREATVAGLSDEEYHAEIKRLSDRYNSYQLSQPTPDDSAFAAARAAIKDKIFEFDADEKPGSLGGADVKALRDGSQPALPAPVKPKPEE